jgi:histidinol-phosphate aminotransferase
MDLDKLLRYNIKGLKPYSSARDEFTGEAKVFLDANENPYNSPYNRYPDPLQRILKDKIAKIKNVSAEKIFLGNGSDEPIDLLIRAFCNPGEDNIVTIHPTYGMYQVAADINDAEVKYVSLNENFDVDSENLLKKTDSGTKLIFLCSPNNPTSNCLNTNEIVKIIEGFEGIVVLDEAYIDFAPGKSLLPVLDKYSNLVILQTFSKAWGMAGIRLGMAFAAPEIIRILNKIKYPYNINILTQKKALKLIDNEKQIKIWIEILTQEREVLKQSLSEISFVETIYPSDANFLLVKMENARSIYETLVIQGIIVRDRTKVHLCGDCLRITVGTPEENLILLNAMKKMKV